MIANNPGRFRRRLATRSVLAATFLILSASARSQSTPPPAPPPETPTLQAVDQRALTQIVRRILAAKIADEPPYAVDYVPPTLASVRCQIVVTLREQAFVRGIGVSKTLPIVDACREAALTAFDSAGFAKEERRKLPADLRIEMQALSPPTPYTGAENWTQPGALVGFIEPGKHGVSLLLDDEQSWFTPAEMISKNMNFAEALRTLCKEASLDPKSLPQARLSRFTALHWWEVDDTGRTVTLHRGMTLVEPEAVTAVGLDETARRIARYLVYRQRPNGRFAYEYRPAADAYGDADDEVAQSGAAWALARYAAHGGGEPVRTAADRAVQERVRRLVELRDVPGAAYVYGRKNRHKLGITAQLCLALADSPDADRWAATRQKLERAMLWLQLDSGKFATAFPPGQILDTQEVFPGQALLALARGQELDPRASVVDAFAKALPYYRKYFRETGSPAMTPWHVQAFSKMARLTKRADYAAFVFEMADAICDHQLTRANGADPELRGAIVTRAMPAGDTTAAFVSALVEAARLARDQSDDARYARYRTGATRGARFVMQLQVRPEECFYMPSPTEAVGGIRSDPITCRLRIDGCQHALLALTQVRDLLFPDSP